MLKKTVAEKCYDLTPEQKLTIICDYEACTSQIECARRNGVSIALLIMVLKEAGLPIRRAGKARLLSLERELQAVSLYSNGDRLDQVAEKLGVSPVTIMRVLQRHGIDRRKAWEITYERHMECMPRRHSLNDGAFSIATQQSAYWIGMMMADGSISSKKWSVSLRLATRDASHVESFRQFLESSHPIQKTDVNSRLSISSRRLWESLNAHGVTPRKTHTARATVLQNDRDFWRGVVDGDGSLSWDNRKRRSYPVISLVGSLPLLTQFVEFVSKNGISSRARANRHKSIFAVCFKGRLAISVIRILYTGADVVLPRKALLAEEMLRTCGDSASIPRGVSHTSPACVASIQS